MQESEEEEAEEELEDDVVAAGEAGRSGRPPRAARYTGEDLALDDIVSQAQRGGARECCAGLGLGVRWAGGPTLPGPCSGGIQEGRALPAPATRVSTLLPVPVSSHVLMGSLPTRLLLPAEDMRNMGVFQTASPGVAAAGEGEGEVDGEGEPRYPEPPARSYRLAELLRQAGLEEAAAEAPDVEISGILTCNSISPTEGALYVCVPSEDGQHDGHDWADEVRPQAWARVGAGGWLCLGSHVPCCAHRVSAPPDREVYGLLHSMCRRLLRSCYLTIQQPKLAAWRRRPPCTPNPTPTPTAHPTPASRQWSRERWPSWQSGLCQMRCCLWWWCPTRCARWALWQRHSTSSPPAAQKPWSEPSLGCWRGRSASWDGQAAWRSNARAALHAWRPCCAALLLTGGDSPTPA